MNITVSDDTIPMRSSVSVILSSPAPDTNMSHPDYEQTAHDHAAMLLLVKHVGKYATEYKKNFQTSHDSVIGYRF